MMPSLAALAAVCGDPAPETVSEPPAGVSYTPQGDMARLRLEVVEDAIACDGGTAEVQVWLDDLPRETVLGSPPKNHFGEVGPNWPPAPLTTGLSAFQFHLRYDPTVVWVANKSDVSVSPDLDSAPPATTDPRNFAAAARLDNHDGDLFAGGIAIGLAMTADPTSVRTGGISHPRVSTRSPQASPSCS